MALRKDILQELMDNAPELARINPSTPYQVPVGYFDHLSTLVLSRIKTLETTDPAEELEILSPFLGGLKKEMPFKAPEGYFENLSPVINEQTPARVISIPFKRALRYAAAAVFAGLIATAVWLFVQPSAVKNSPLAQTTDSSILRQVQQFSDVEIEYYVNTQNAVVNYESNNASEIQDEDVRLMLSEITDKELENYLN